MGIYADNGSAHTNYHDNVRKIVFEENMDNEIFQIANKYDTNFDQEYDYEEFKGFAKEIGKRSHVL